MEKESGSDKLKTITLSNGTIVTIHYRTAYPSLQEQMIEIMNRYIEKRSSL